MKNIKIKLDSIVKVNNFVNIASRCDGDVKLKLEKFTVNGKSAIDICTLDLKNELILNIEPEEDLSAIIGELKPYIIA